MKTRESIVARWDAIARGVAVAVLLLGLAVIAGWHLHLRGVVQVFRGTVPMQYNTALALVALASAGLGLAPRRRLLLLVGGAATVLLSAPVLVEYASGRTLGIDTFFFFPWDQTLSADPGRMALTTAISFLLSGTAALALAWRPGTMGTFGIFNAITAALALTSLVGYVYGVTYVVPFTLGSQMALHTALAMFAYALVMLSHAWIHAERGSDGLPKWAAGIGVALFPVLFGTVSPLEWGASWESASFGALVALAGVASTVFAVRGLSTAKMAVKGMIMIAIPLLMLLVFAVQVARVKDQSETAQEWERHSAEVLGVTAALPVRLLESQYAVRGYLITGDDTLIASSQRAMGSALQTIARVRSLVSDNPTQEERIRHVGEIMAQRVEDFRQIALLAKTGKANAINNLAETGRGSEPVRQINAELDAFSLEEARLAVVRQQVLSASWQRLDWLLVSGTATAILLSGILMLVFSGGIGRRLRRVSDNATDLAAGGKLAPMLSGNDEIAQLDRAFHEMADTLDSDGLKADARHVEALQQTRESAARKLIERTLEQKNIELEHASRMKSEFLATMSHELRTPLNAIVGFSEALKDGLVGRMSDLQHEYIADIFTSGQHLLALINDILDLSKVEAGMMTLELEAVDLHTLLASSLSIVREKAAQHRIRVTLMVEDDLGIALLDERKTKQIIYNLLSNAVKFTANGGRVTMRVRRVARIDVGVVAGDWPVHRFDLADSEYNEFLELSVLDSGIGISSGDMARLFQAFSQIDSSLARKFEGTGLGLAMVKQLAELHGGSVAVASAVGLGAQFLVWLPMRALAPSAAIPPPRTTAASSTDPVEVKERTALVIEDDDASAELIRLLLEAEGFVVLRAVSGEDALQMAPAQPLGLITLDIQLPGIDGWEFLHRIQLVPTLAHVPVVVIASVAEVNLALSRGAAAVLQKPIGRAQLRTALADLGLNASNRHVRTILVVDDDPKAVEAIAAFLPAPAYEVVRAYGGNEAIALARHLCPDLVLLDLMMPEVTGFDVVDALRGTPATARIPIIIVTAKEISKEDITQLNGHADSIVHVVPKLGFNRVGFITEVRRALLPN